MASALGPRWPLRPALGGGGGGRLLFVLLCASAGLPRSGQQVLRIGECRPRALRAPHRGTARSRRRGPGRCRGLLAPGLFPYPSPRVLCLCRRSGTRVPPAGLGAARGEPPRWGWGCGRRRRGCPRRVDFLGGAFARGAGRSQPRLLRCRALRGSAVLLPKLCPGARSRDAGKLGAGVPAERSGAGPGIGTGPG